MSQPTSPYTHPAVREPVPAAVGIQRTPFYLESQGQPLFAWLHRPEHAWATEHGVLICPPVGHEQIHAHRSLRHLADALAGAGLAAVRFDYHGTGDSPGTDEDPERVATWLSNVRDACAWLKDRLGCRRISLVGLRLGATLAGQAAGSWPVEGLVLWGPVVKGRSYVRELKALSLTAARPRSAGEGAGDIEAAGFVFTGQTAQHLSRLDLLQAAPLCRRALIVVRDDVPQDTVLLDHLTGLGIEARQTTQPGYADMMAEPHYSKVPGQAIARIADWLRTGPESETSPKRERGTANAAGGPLAGASGFCGGGIRERVLTIGERPGLFGIVTEPSDADPGLPVVVLLNAGSAYRAGPNRLYVSLARRLADRGFRCLRLDLCGLGDSISPDPGRENDPYPATAFRDIDRTLQHLQAQLGARRVVLLGLCSGAYAAFQSAAQLRSPLLVESVLINPLTFFWRDGMSLEAGPALQLKSFQDSLASVWQPAKWLKLLSGRSKLGIAGALRLLVQRWKLGGSAGRQQASADPVTATADGVPSHPAREDLPGDLQRVGSTGRHLACFFARSDPGYGLLMLQAKRQAEALRRAGKLDVYFFDGADHTFSVRAARVALGQALAEHLTRRYLGSAR